MQQWYQHYQAQAHSYSAAAQQNNTATDYSKEHTQVTHVFNCVGCSIYVIGLKSLIFKYTTFEKLFNSDHREQQVVMGAQNAFSEIEEIFFLTGSIVKLPRALSGSVILSLF